MGCLTLELVSSGEKETRWIFREEGRVNDLRLFFVTLTISGAFDTE